MAEEQASGLLWPSEPHAHWVCMVTLTDPLQIAAFVCSLRFTQELQTLESCCLERAPDVPINTHTDKLISPESSKCVLMGLSSCMFDFKQQKGRVLETLTFSGDFFFPPALHVRLRCRTCIIYHGGLLSLELGSSPVLPWLAGLTTIR